MEVVSNTNSTKRLRDDSDANSSAPKLARVDSPSDANSSESLLTRVNSGEECVNSSGFELVRVDSDDPVLIQNDLLNILDDTDNIPDRENTMQDLDSVIKSFEEEILASGPPDPDPIPELQMDLGYLLEASDDELGLPPSVTHGEETKPAESEALERVGSDNTVGSLGFEDEIAGYDSVGHGGGVGFDGLLDYPESIGDPYDREEAKQSNSVRELRTSRCGNQNKEED
ncbi:uncharacterized protein G2W53_025320 [Senna tora]|uniref:Uncharacterized protein n=1 Tax=Senna tora TaxID=362788 RepID=A0A834TFC3_9FABA|nr:uncharacterized protein G2W53_025320 [Senna tora]